MKMTVGIFKFLKKTQNVMCVEVLHDIIRAALFRARLDEGELHLVSHTSIPVDGEHATMDTYADGIRQLLETHGKNKKMSVILGFRNNAAVTTRLAASVSRSQTANAIQESELEDLLFKAQWRIFDETRSVLAAKMGISDLDLHLVDAKVEEVRLDGHRVINPVGFRPRLVEFDIANTFVSRRLIQSIRGMLSESQRLDLVIESDTALANTLLRTFKQESGIVLSLGKSTTRIMAVNNRSMVYNQQFSWGLASLVRAIGKYLGVKPYMAYQILELCMAGNTSAYFAKKIEKVLGDEMEWFFEGVRIGCDAAIARGELPDTIFVNQETVLPPFVIEAVKTHPWPKQQFKKNPNVVMIDNTFLARELSFEKPLPNSFAALLDEYLYGEQGEHFLNGLLHKRIRWLEV